MHMACGSTFPIAFLIKSTVGVLALFLLTVVVIATRRLNRWREILFLVVPVDLLSDWSH